MAVVKTVQVFNVNTLDRVVLESLMCALEMGSDSYHRWYPELGWGSEHEGLTELDEQMVNAWLRENGMVKDPDPGAYIAAQVQSKGVHFYIQLPGGDVLDRVATFEVA